MYFFSPGTNNIKKVLWMYNYLKPYFEVLGRLVRWTFWTNVQMKHLYWAVSIIDVEVNMICRFVKCSCIQNNLCKDRTVEEQWQNDKIAFLFLIQLSYRDRSLSHCCMHGQNRKACGLVHVSEGKTHRHIGEPNH